MAIKTSDLNAKLFGKTNKRVVSTVKDAQVAAKDQAQMIELAVAGQEKIAFELLEIPAKDIATQTYVFAQNAREQSFLNEHALSDILATLKVQGQQFPAVGRLCQDGKIEVLDGSRRRMSCILAKKPFLIYVAKDITTKDAKFLSDVANAHKPLSLYEKGKEMQFMLDQRLASDQKSLAQVYQCSEALVSGALKAAALPLEILQTYPNISDVGRPTIVKLYKQYFSLSDEMKAEFVERCRNQKNELWKGSTTQGLARLTKAVSEQLERWILELSPQEIKPKPAQIVVNPNFSYQQKGEQVQLTLKKVSPDMLDKIVAMLKKELS